MRSFKQATGQAFRAVAQGAILAMAGWLLAACAAGPASLPADATDLRTASDQTNADRRASARLELASAYFARGQLVTALDEVKLALAARPDLPEGLNLRGLIYAALGICANRPSSHCTSSSGSGPR